tara:strand:+ start:566 stop:1564 length:999 start_codon:yes stop_codon:yes gene_type:complete
MAHGITESDGLVLHKKMAWHGFGNVVEEAPTPYEALGLANLNWKVNQTESVRGTTENGDTFDSPKWRLNIRSDNSEVLGCVSENYVPIQNSDVAHFCEQISQDTVVKVESAGSLFGGRQLWFLLKAETFEMGRDGKEDPIAPYILVANSHDSTLAFSARPTSVRVVCNNTLSWAMNRKQNVFNLRHTGSILDRVDIAREELQNYMSGIDKFKVACNHLRNTTINREEIQRFFFQMYERCVGVIPDEGPHTSDEDYRKRDKAMKSIEEVCNNFDEELSVAGDSYWNAFNASSRWLQNRNNSKNPDTRMFNKMMGAANDNTSKAFNLALSSAGA